MLDYITPQTIPESLQSEFSRGLLDFGTQQLSGALQSFIDTRVDESYPISVVHGTVAELRGWI